MPGNVRRPCEDEFSVGLERDDVLDRVDDSLHRGDVRVRHEYRVIGQQIGVRITEASIQSRLPEAGLQRLLQLPLVDSNALTALVQRVGERFARHVEILPRTGTECLPIFELRVVSQDRYDVRVANIIDRLQLLFLDLGEVLLEVVQLEAQCIG